MIRPKRHYVPPLPKARTRRWGWSGLSRYVLLVLLFGAPDAYAVWRWSRYDDPAVFWILTAGYVLCFGIFCVIARPWTARGFE